MKKRIAATLLCVVLLLLVACGAEESTTPQPEEALPVQKIEIIGSSFLFQKIETEGEVAGALAEYIAEQEALYQGAELVFAPDGSFTKTRPVTSERPLTDFYTTSYEVSGDTVTVELFDTPCIPAETAVYTLSGDVLKETVEKEGVQLIYCYALHTQTNAEPLSYRSVSPEEAKKLMETQEGYILLDVRAPEEFAEGHIPGAICIPHDAVKEAAPEQLPDRNQLILVYCRSGRRSKLASEALAELGYTQIVEFGGILSWPYEIEP